MMTRPIDYARICPSCGRPGRLSGNACKELEIASKLGTGPDADVVAAIDELERKIAIELRAICTVPSDRGASGATRELNIVASGATNNPNQPPPI